MRLGMLLAIAALMFADAASASVLRLARQTVLPTPAGVCGGVADASTPTVDADPAGKVISASLLLRGGEAASFARSVDGGRKFAPEVIAGASACSGGAPDHAYLVNPRAALGPDGTAWYGSSWAGTDGALFDYGIKLFAAGGGVARPSGGNQQDVAVLPDATGGGARMLWNQLDQIPNPATYLPPATRLLTARAARDGSLSGEVTALDPGAGQILDDPSLVRDPDGTLVAVASVAPLSDLATFLNPATADEPVRFTGVSARSVDGGATWTRGGLAGRPVIFTFRRDGIEMLVGLTAADGAHGRIVRVYAGEPTDGRGRLLLTQSTDGGRSWSEPRSVVDVPVLLYQPAVAVLPGGRLALTWYDARDDVEGDGRLDLRPWAAVLEADGTTRREVALGPAFDFRPLQAPGYPVDNSALGISQDVVALPAGFGAVHTEPAAAPGVTRVVYSRLSTKPKARRTKKLRRPARPRRAVWRTGARVPVVP